MRGGGASPCLEVPAAAAAAHMVERSVAVQRRTKGPLPEPNDSPTLWCHARGDPEDFG